MSNIFILSESEILILSSQLCPASVFIEQHVHQSIHHCLSVRDILRYAFLFKNHSKNFHLMEDHIASTINKLLLPIDILETDFGKCSGGQQRRIAIAQELMNLTPPDFLFVSYCFVAITVLLFNFPICLIPKARRANNGLRLDGSL